MKKYLLAFLFTSISITLLGQSKNSWFKFHNKDSTLVGFKDKNGNVKIEPKFEPYMVAKKIDNIAAVTEHGGKSYYITKKNRIVVQTIYITLIAPRIVRVKVTSGSPIKKRKKQACLTAMATLLYPLFIII